uniref:Ig-like domain-containing protein n=1 Tax=Xiphophorus couchianus TaxID=32473 RepID=A0A3B5L0V5_9TELE
SVTMTLLWLTLLLLHQVCKYYLLELRYLVTVELGQSVTLTCDFTMKYQSNTWLYWYKQSPGNILTLIVKITKTITPNYGPEISPSKFNATSNEHSSSLTIFTTVHEDEGMYHCAQMDRLNSGCFFFFTVHKLTLNQQNYQTVRDQTTLQCSVLSDSENKTCSGEPSVFWFRAISEKSFPDMIYTDGKSSDNCEKSSDSPKKCFYNFSKNISSSDLGTYYCAVATCGQIIFGNGIKNAAMICLVISVIFNIVFICFRTQRSTEVGPDLNYAALHFSEGRTSRGKKKRELMTDESVYSQVKG